MAPIQKTRFSSNFRAMCEKSLSNAVSVLSIKIQAFSLLLRPVSSVGQSVVLITRMSWVRPPHWPQVLTQSRDPEIIQNDPKTIQKRSKKDPKRYSSYGFYPLVKRLRIGSEKTQFRPGSNRGPFACQANVITTTLRKLVKNAIL